MHTTPNSPFQLEEPPAAPPAPACSPELSVPPAFSEFPELPEFSDFTELPEARGCLYALSQPPLMLFLAVIAALLAITGAHDLFLL